MNKKTWNIYMEKALLEKVENGANLVEAVNEMKAHLKAESEWISERDVRENFRKKVEEKLTDVQNVDDLNKALPELKKVSEEGRVALEGVRPVVKK